MRLLKILEESSEATVTGLVEKHKLKVGMSSYDVDWDASDDRVHMNVLQNGLSVAEMIYETGEIVWIHVEPFFRRQGIGTAMVEFLREHAGPVPIPEAKTTDGSAFFATLSEGANTKCIVVDVQPQYTGMYDGDELPWIDDLMSFLNNQGPILMFANAEETGLTDDSIEDIKVYWEDSGFNPTRWNQTEIVDKGYGYFRAWMDEGVAPAVIIKVIREMYNQGVNDSRELFDEDVEQFAEFVGPSWEEWMYDDPLIVEWTSVGQLKRYSGAYIMGGGREECLREVELLMNAFNIKYRRVEEFVYG